MAPDKQNAEKGHSSIDGVHVTTNIQELETSDTRRQLEDIIAGLEKKLRNKDQALWFAHATENSLRKAVKNGELEAQLLREDIRNEQAERDKARKKGTKRGLALKRVEYLLTDLRYEVDGATTTGCRTGWEPEVNLQDHLEQMLDKTRDELDQVLEEVRESTADWDETDDKTESFAASCGWDTVSEGRSDADDDSKSEFSSGSE